jgi:UDP-N-acetylglucosamine--N-acetylmuramyl-(pentapeptide) pyrophosphoryl-undecaprenol N-acetylglucosamine transferase
MSSHKFILSGGGTGGHIFPAVAIANALKAEYPTCEILFVGANNRMEMEKVPAAGYKIIGLDIRGLKRSFSLSNLSLPFTLFKALRHAKRIISDFKPSVAIGVGGYASGALLYVAAKNGIPTLIQEQNSYAGITNKLLGKRVNRICVAYENMQRFFPASKIVLTGNPVRKEIIEAPNRVEEGRIAFGLNSEKVTVLVVGGSLGAKSINESVLKGLEQLEAANVQLIWQTGISFAPEAQAAIKNLNNPDFQTHAFIKEMDLAYAAADVVVSRAGALAVAELAIMGKASILVPFPFAAEDHQTMNARALSDHHAAIRIADLDASSQLVPEILRLVGNSDERIRLANAIRRFAKPNATEAIVEQIKTLIAK